MFELGAVGLLVLLWLGCVSTQAIYRQITSRPSGMRVKMGASEVLAASWLLCRGRPWPGA